MLKIKIELLDVVFYFLNMTSSQIYTEVSKLSLIRDDVDNIKSC